MYLPGVRVQTRTITKPNQTLHIPNVYQLRNKLAQHRMNKQIIDTVMKEVSEIQYPETTITSSYKVTLNRGGILSILLQVDWYTEGAAHGMSVRRSLTFNVENGHLYRFNELFRPNSDYRNYLSRKVKEYIRTNNIITIADFNQIDQDQEYYLRRGHLVLYYQLYEYTPYAYGFFEVPVPFTELLPYLSIRSPISLLWLRSQQISG